MDLYCPRCGEPWDFDSLHEEAELRYRREYGVAYEGGYGSAENQQRYSEIYNMVSAEFRIRGCQALREFRATEEPCQESSSSERGKDRAAAASAMYDLLGDDLDGAAAMLEDAGF